MGRAGTEGGVWGGGHKKGVVAAAGQIAQPEATSQQSGAFYAKALPAALWALAAYFAVLAAGSLVQLVRLAGYVLAGGR